DKLCQALLGERLLLSGVPTVWCGTEAGRRAALASLDKSVIRGAFDAVPLFAKGSSARLGAELDTIARAKLLETLARRGAAYVVQQIAPLSTAPLYENGQLVPRPIALRVFAAWTPRGYVVMPGGLTRVAPDDSLRSLSMQSGAASKDTWVLSDGPID